VIVVLVLLVLPYVLINTPTFVLAGNTVALGLDTASYAVVAAVTVLSMVLLIGRCGELSLASGFFLGVGAYVAGGLYLHAHVNLLIATIGGSVACGLLGGLLGLPALRIRGAYLALVTITLAAVLPALVRLPSLKSWTGGSNGLLLPGNAEAPSWLPVRQAPELLGHIPFVGPFYIGTNPLSPAQAGAVWTYLAVLAGAAVVFWLVAGVIRGRVGRALSAVRDHEIGAAASGVNTARLKVMAYAVSAAIAGAAGGMYVAVYRILAPDTFGITLAIFLLFGLILGGQRSLLGAVIGGVAVAYLPFLTASIDHVPGVPDRWLSGPTASLVLGVLLVLLALLVPGGFSDPERARRREQRRSSSQDLVRAPNQGRSPTHVASGVESSNF
jgi:branched-chain amino acid transport system permease protein